MKIGYELVFYDQKCDLLFIVDPFDYWQLVQLDILICKGSSFITIGVL
jgi:hypothetical protein